MREVRRAGGRTSAAAETKKTSCTLTLDLSMNLPALLCLLGLVAAAWSCRRDCKPASHMSSFHFQHVSELQNSSVAPWTLEYDNKSKWIPYSILKAKCSDCTVKDMVAKPIHLQILVYVHEVEPITNKSQWCQCPYSLAVGCTCVRQ